MCGSVKPAPVGSSVPPADGQLRIVRDTESSSASGPISAPRPINASERPGDDLGIRNLGCCEPTDIVNASAHLILPAADTKRWSSRRKAAVLVAIRTGVLTREEACERYLISEEELALWEAAFDRNGIPGLRISSLRNYRLATLFTGKERQ
jgi:Protein of unknown function (DUF1153)